MLLAYIMRICFFLILMIKCCSCQATTPQCSRGIVGALPSWAQKRTNSQTQGISQSATSFLGYQKRQEVGQEKKPQQNPSNLF